MFYVKEIFEDIDGYKHIMGHDSNSKYSITILRPNGERYGVRSCQDEKQAVALMDMVKKLTNDLQQEKKELIEASKLDKKVEAVPPVSPIEIHKEDITKFIQGLFPSIKIAPTGERIIKKDNVEALAKMQEIIREKKEKFEEAQKKSVSSNVELTLMSMRNSIGDLQWMVKDLTTAYEELEKVILKK